MSATVSLSAPHDTAPRLVTLPSGRTVGYRRFGDGPPLVLLHASPRSAAALLPLGLRLASEHTVFAFDTPGFGWSDTLPLPRPDAEDLGDALIEAFDAIGIRRAPVYGSHTGAAIAVAAALRHPSRVAALVLDGFAIFTPTEQAEYLANYLVPIRPSWDGSHLALLWSRVKDQFTVFPWYLNSHAARIPRKLPSPDMLQGVIVDFLAAGDHYRAGYAAAFRFDGLSALRRLTVPALVLARCDDLLFSHLDALRDLPPHVTVGRLGEDLAVWAHAVRDGLAAGGAGSLTPRPTAEQHRESPYRPVRVPGGVIGVLHVEGPAERPLVLLPGIPGSARGEAALARALARTRPVHAIDLPGFGASSLPEGSTREDIAAAIRAALPVQDFDVVAIGESASIAAALRPVRRVTLDKLPEGAPMLAHMADVTPRPDGAHLLAAWHQLRDMTLWRPWFTADPAHAIDRGTDPDVPRLHAILTDWMRGGTAGRQTLAAAMAPPHDGSGPPGQGHTQSVRSHPDRHATAAAILAQLGAMP